MSAKSRILIVEDEMVISMELAATLRRLGYDVAGQVTTGEDAISKAGSTDPDLILMDIRLQGNIDGIEAAGRIRDEYDIPVIFLTAHSDEHTLERAISTQPSGYLIKPIRDRELYSTIELALRKQDILQRIRPEMIEDEGMKAISKSPDPCLFVSRRWTILAANDPAVRLLGGEDRNIVGTRIDNLIFPPAGGSDGMIWPDMISLRTSEGRIIRARISVGARFDRERVFRQYILQIKPE